MKTGTLTDASLIEADVKRPPQEDGEVAERDPDVLAIHSGTGGAGVDVQAAVIHQSGGQVVG